MVVVALGEPGTPVICWAVVVALGEPGTPEVCWARAGMASSVGRGSNRQGNRCCGPGNADGL